MKSTGQIKSGLGFEQLLLSIRVPKMGVPWGTPIAGWFTMEHPIQRDDLGLPLF